MKTAKTASVDEVAAVVQAQPHAAETSGATLRARRYTRMSLALVILAIIAVIATLHYARAFFAPLLIGILVSYALHPVVDWLEILRIPRAAAAALVMGILIGGFSWIGYSLAGEATALIEKLPDRKSVV